MPVDFSQWVAEFRENFNDSPKRAVMQAVWCSYLGLWFTLTSRFTFGQKIYERDWDALILLDACRSDALREVAPEYDFLDQSEIESVWSVGSGSLEFMCKNFTYEHRDQINDTVYTAANGFLNRAFVEHEYAPSVAIPFGRPKYNVVRADDFKELTNVWDSRYSEELKNVPPSEMTDAAISAGRRNPDASKYIFHFTQPHIPHISDAVEEGRPVTEEEADPWKYIRRGELSYEVAYERYLDNLRLVLDNVETLLENLDVDTAVISADHGEAFGEWRVNGHPTAFPHPAVKKVPWIEVTAEDRNTRQPEPIPEEVNNCKSISESTVQQQLEDLGYI